VDVGDHNELDEELQHGGVDDFEFAGFGDGDDHQAQVRNNLDELPAEADRGERRMVPGVDW